jgi:hypothetical protein
MNETKRPRRRGRRDFGSIKTDGTPTDPRFSVRWFEGGRMRRKRGFGTRGEAEAFLARVRVDITDGKREPGHPVSFDVSVSAAIEAYGRHLAEKGNKSGPMADTLYRLGRFFPDGTVLLSELTVAKCAGYYSELRSRTTRLMKPYAADSHRNMLAEARSLLKWCFTVKGNAVHLRPLPVGALRL